MLQIVSAAPRPDGVDSDACGDPDPLLSFAGAIGGSHALVLAPDGVDLLCRLLRQGCAAATALRPNQRPDHEGYDLVITPQIASAAEVGRLIEQARRALVPNGRFLAFVPEVPCTAELLVRSLRLAGFTAMQTRRVPEGVLVRSDRPSRDLPGALPQQIRRQA